MRLSVLIPTRDEARALPLLLADLQRWPGELEVLVADGGSRDATTMAACLAGARVLHCTTRGRGQQLRTAAEQAKGLWLLVLHADSRLSETWAQAIASRMHDPMAVNHPFHFDLRIQGSDPMLRMVEQGVALRCHWLHEPYGDQGLLIHRGLYDRVGGFRPIPLMEDLELVQRLNRISQLRSLGEPITTSARRWEHDGVLERTWRNAQIRWRWHHGARPEQLLRDYSRPVSWRTRKRSDGPEVPDPSPGADRN